MFEQRLTGCKRLGAIKVQKKIIVGSGTEGGSLQEAMGLGCLIVDMLKCHN